MTALAGLSVVGVPLLVGGSLIFGVYSFFSLFSNSKK
jgi:hypothetical protein